MSVFIDIYDFYSEFSGKKGVLGHSAFGMPIFFMAVEKTKTPKIIFQYSIHAREYITSYLALEQVKDFMARGKKGTAYFIPCVNPDGVDIAEKDCRLYKANGRGVDLNVNFPADWGQGEKNTRQKGDENFIGENPFSEPETRALGDFTLSVAPDMTVSYHSKGEEVYYEFHQKGANKIRDKKIAKKVANLTGYQIKNTPNSCGGYKDWCIESLKIPAITIEVGADRLSHPIEKEQLNEIFKKNKEVVITLMNEVKI